MRVGLEYIIAEKNLTGINRMTRALLTEVLRLDCDNEYYSIDHNYLQLALPKEYGAGIGLIESGNKKSPFELSPEITNLFRLRCYCCDIQLLHSYFRPFHDLHFKGTKILTIYDLTQSLHPEWVPGKEFFDEQIQKSAKEADAIIAISEYTKQDIIKYFDIPENKIKVIYCGLDHNLDFANADRQLLDLELLNTPYILSVASKALHKNLKGVLLGFLRFKEQYPDTDTRLVLIGPDLDNEILEIAGAKYCKDIISMGYVNDQVLASLYKFSLGVIYVSFCEGFGLPVLEAMSAGKATITSNTTSIPEVGGDAVIYCDPYEIESISDAFYTLVYREDIRRSCEIKAKERASLFSYKKAAFETLELYNQFQ